MNKPLTIQQALINASTTLQTLANPKREAEYLLAALLEKDRSYCFAFAERELTNQQQQQFDTFVKRRAAGEPLAQIIGKKDFWNFTLNVSKDVLIPRPETELLVEKTLACLPADEVCQVVDLGTGSGAIALALASEKPQWELLATDASLAAIEIARANAEQLNINNVLFAQGSWCNALPEKKYHAIVSNPPYIADDDNAIEHHVAKFEPATALFAADAGMADLITIISQAKNYLVEDGVLLLEHGYQQAAAVRACLREQGYHNIETLKDLHGCERVSLGVKALLSSKMR